MPEEIEIKTSPPDLFRRVNVYHKELEKAITDALKASLVHIQNSVPEYPPPPATSTYRRTGTLGRSLHINTPDNVTQIKTMGRGQQEAHFGTRVHYAPRVIGERQRMPWKGYWWNVKVVVKNATPGIKRIFEKMAKDVAGWIEGKKL